MSQKEPFEFSAQIPTAVETTPTQTEPTTEQPYVIIPIDQTTEMTITTPPPMTSPIERVIIREETEEKQQSLSVEVTAGGGGGAITTPVATTTSILTDDTGLNMTTPPDITPHAHEVVNEDQSAEIDPTPAIAVATTTDDAAGTHTQPSSVEPITPTTADEKMIVADARIEDTAEVDMDEVKTNESTVLTDLHPLTAIDASMNPPVETPECKPSSVTDVVVSPPSEPITMMMTVDSTSNEPESVIVADEHNQQQVEEESIEPKPTIEEEAHTTVAATPIIDSTTPMDTAMESAITTTVPVIEAVEMDVDVTPASITAPPAQEEEEQPGAIKRVESVDEEKKEVIVADETVVDHAADQSHSAESDHEELIEHHLPEPTPVNVASLDIQPTPTTYELDDDEHHLARTSSSQSESKSESSESPMPVEESTQLSPIESKDECSSEGGSSRQTSDVSEKKETGEMETDESPQPIPHMPEQHTMSVEEFEQIQQRLVDGEKKIEELQTALIERQESSKETESSLRSQLQTALNAIQIEKDLGTQLRTDSHAEKTRFETLIAEFDSNHRSATESYQAQLNSAHETTARLESQLNQQLLAIKELQTSLTQSQTQAQSAMSELTSTRTLLSERTDEMQKLEADLGMVSTALKTKEVTCAGHQTELAANAQELHQLRLQATPTQHLIEARDLEIKAKSQELNEKANQLTQQKYRLDELADELKTAQLEIKKSTKRVKEGESKIIDLETQLKELPKVQSELAELKTVHAASLTEIHTLKENLKAAEIRSAQDHLTAEELEAHCKSTEQKVASLTKELESAQHTIQAGIEERNELVQKIATKDDFIQSQRVSYDSVNSAIVVYRQQKANLMKQIQELQKRIEELDRQHVSDLTQEVQKKEADAQLISTLQAQVNLLKEELAANKKQFAQQEQVIADQEARIAKALTVPTLEVEEEKKSAPLINAAIKTSPKDESSATKSVETILSPPLVVPTVGRSLPRRRLALEVAQQGVAATATPAATEVMTVEPSSPVVSPKDKEKKTTKSKKADTSEPIVIDATPSSSTTRSSSDASNTTSSATGSKKGKKSKKKSTTDASAAAESTPVLPIVTPMVDEAPVSISPGSEKKQLRTRPKTKEQIEKEKAEEDERNLQAALAASVAESITPPPPSTVASATEAEKKSAESPKGGRKRKSTESPAVAPVEEKKLVESASTTTAAPMEVDHQESPPTSATKAKPTKTATKSVSTLEVPKSTTPTVDDSTASGLESAAKKPRTSPRIEKSIAHLVNDAVPVAMSKNQRPVIVFSGFKPDSEYPMTLLEELKKTVTDLGGTVLEGGKDFDERITHCVAPLHCHTPKSLGAALNHKWICQPNWITFSGASGAFLDEKSSGELCIKYTQQPFNKRKFVLTKEFQASRADRSTLAPKLIECGGGHILPFTPDNVKSADYIVCVSITVDGGKYPPERCLDWERLMNMIPGYTKSAGGSKSTKKADAAPAVSTSNVPAVLPNVTTSTKLSSPPPSSVITPSTSDHVMSEKEKFQRKRKSMETAASTASAATEEKSATKPVSPKITAPTVGPPTTPTIRRTTPITAPASAVRPISPASASADANKENEPQAANKISTAATADKSAEPTKPAKKKAKISSTKKSSSDTTDDSTETPALTPVESVASESKKKKKTSAAAASTVSSGRSTKSSTSKASSGVSEAASESSHTTGTSGLTRRSAKSTKSTKSIAVVDDDGSVPMEIETKATPAPATKPPTRTSSRAKH